MANCDSCQLAAQATDGRQGGVRAGNIRDFMTAPQEAASPLTSAAALYLGPGCSVQHCSFCACTSGHWAHRAWRRVTLPAGDLQLSTDSRIDGTMISGLHWVTAGGLAVEQSPLAFATKPNQHLVAAAAWDGPRCSRGRHVHLKLCSGMRQAMTRGRRSSSNDMGVPCGGET